MGFDWKIPITSKNDFHQYCGNSRCIFHSFAEPLYIFEMSSGHLSFNESTRAAKCAVPYVVVVDFTAEYHHDGGHICGWSTSTERKFAHVRMHCANNKLYNWQLKHFSLLNKSVLEWKIKRKLWVISFFFLQLNVARFCVALYCWYLKSIVEPLRIYFAGAMFETSKEKSQRDAINKKKK